MNIQIFCLFRPLSTLLFVYLYGQKLEEYYRNIMDYFFFALLICGILKILGLISTLVSCFPPQTHYLIETEPH